MNLILSFLVTLAGFAGAARAQAAEAEDSGASLPGRRVLDVEFLYLDLATCGRCKGTGAALESALAEVTPLFRKAGAEVRLRKILVATRDEAERLRFALSPTVRINGNDIALASRQSTCADCGDLCGCSEIDCRVWMWEGREHVEAPEAMLLDALLRGYAGAFDMKLVAAAPPFVLPENMAKFFAGKRAAASARGSCCAPADSGEPCCDDPKTCCGVQAEAAPAQTKPAACCDAGQEAATPAKSEAPEERTSGRCCVPSEGPATRKQEGGVDR